MCNQWSSFIAGEVRLNELELQICTMATKSLVAVASQLRYLVQIKQVQLPLHLPCTLETRETKAWVHYPACPVLKRFFSLRYIPGGSGKHRVKFKTANKR